MASKFVDIWSGSLTLPEQSKEKLLATLDESERKKASAFKTPLLRDRFIAVRGLLRQTLADYLETRPESLRFDVGEYGKPCLSCASLHFNLSHSGDRLLIAVADIPDVGVDIETISPRVNLDALASRVFSEQELARWRQLVPDQQLPGFYRLWTKKEAFVKAVGRGISLGMERCEFELEQGGQLIAIPDEYGDITGWQVTELESQGQICAALVTKNCDFILRNYDLPSR